MRRRVAYTRRVLRFAGSFSRGIHYEAAVKKPQDDTPRVRGKRRRSDSTRVTREPSRTARRGAARRVSRDKQADGSVKRETAKSREGAARIPESEGEASERNLARAERAAPMRKRAPRRTRNAYTPAAAAGPPRRATF